MSFSVSCKKFVGYAGSLYSEGFSEHVDMNKLKSIVTSCVWSPIVWEKGARNTKNFKKASFLVLDFDQPGEESLDQMNNSLEDHKRIIATTKSHMKDKNGVTCERYRLVIPFDKVITDLNLYRHTMDCALKKYSWADKSCRDGARFFFPCSKIIYMDRQAEYSWDTTSVPIKPELSVKQQPGNRIPLWCLNFINHGVLCQNQSRNLTVYATAFTLFSMGYEVEKVCELIKRAPIDWRGVNFDGALKSAKGKVT